MAVDRSRVVCALVLFLVLPAVLMVSVSAASSRDVAVSSVSEAEQSITHAYAAVLDAERVGGNVSGLLVRLDEGVGLLSNASRALEAGDFDEAVRWASLSVQVGGMVWDDAERLRVETVDAGVDRFWLLCGVSVVSVAVVVFVGFLGYRYFKQWYFQRLLKMKPKVGHD